MNSYRNFKNIQSLEKDKSPTQIQISTWENDGGQVNEIINNILIMNGHQSSLFLQNNYTRVLKLLTTHQSKRESQ
jgi:hypothetical protein